MTEYEDTVKSMILDANTQNGSSVESVHMGFEHFVYSNVPCGLESRFYVRGVPHNHKIWERLGYWFLKKAGYELVWPKDV